jgi:hypothetical protein
MGEQSHLSTWPDVNVLRLAARHRTAILSDIIVNECLKLLQINYLARKVDVF